MMRKPSRPRPRGAADSAEVPQADPVPAAAADSVPERVGDELTPAGYGGTARVLATRGENRDRVVSTGLADRLEERRRAHRRLRHGRLLRAAGALTVAALLVWAALFSPLLALRPAEITVTGADATVDAGAVQEALSAHTGQSLLRLDVTALGEEVADSLVRVKSATVTRSWPHGLSVRLNLRVPVAVRQTDDGYEVLDGEAVVLETPTRAPDGLAVIAAEPGRDLSESQVAAVTEAIGSLNADVRAQVAEGKVSDTGQVTLTLTSGAKVVWGDNTENALKAQVLAVLLGQEAQTYDVSSPHSPTTS
ncbi:cell division protein FtsQ [Actinomyces ruminicola]|uniref:Cell division protein FtsQ n=1 Tax=Actinomyces ruminicola TaxID=332524 RepID=A0A1G9ZBB2_9ACTO|nr:FtsQ-type POTRA domain-containing protein [Actinomyces ruminicola]SDN17763.1 cell division protein FtsQ [Actinomyces ruminicola]